MIFNTEGNTTVITQEKASIIELVKKVQIIYPKFKNDNIIINISSLKQLTSQDIIEFSQISNQHRSAKHSFVLVSNKISIDSIPNELIIVPSLEEAYDIIEIEDIERDLGF